MEFRSCYSSKTNKLAPVIDPPPEFDLPFEILFKVNTLVHNACLPGPTLDTEFYKLVDPKTHDRAFIDYTLHKLLCIGKCSYAPVSWLRQEYSKWGKKGKPTQSTLGDELGLFPICRVQVTPTRVYFSGPELNESNRVLREYDKHINSFIIVSFVDENLKSLFSKDLSPSSSTTKKTKVYKRIYSVLTDGVVIDKKISRFGCLHPATRLGQRISDH